MLQHIGDFIARARQERGLTQRELAKACMMDHTLISRIENRKRHPSLKQLQRIAEVVDRPLQFFVTGWNIPGITLLDLAVELRYMGMSDLVVANAKVPGAFRPREQVLALALRGDPEPRVIEALPTLFAWNELNKELLVAYGRAHDPRGLNRMAWLADIALTIHATKGFPGGMFNGLELRSFINRVRARREKENKRSKEQQPRIDDLGRPAADLKLPPVSKRWHITYAASVQTFLKRAEDLWRDRQHFRTLSRQAEGVHE